MASRAKDQSQLPCDVDYSLGSFQLRDTSWSPLKQLINDTLRSALRITHRIVGILLSAGLQLHRRSRESGDTSKHRTVLKRIIVRHWNDPQRTPYTGQLLAIDQRTVTSTVFGSSNGPIISKTFYSKNEYSCCLGVVRQ